MSTSASPRHSDELVRFEQQHPRSREAFERARKLMPGGVAQVMRGMQPFPIAIARGEGARKWDVDGNEYVDYHFGSGALLLGHAHPEVMEAIQQAVTSGWHFAQPHLREAEWGEWIQRSGAERRAVALRELGYRSGHAGDSPGPRLQRQAEGAALRRPLPRLAERRHPRPNSALHAHLARRNARRVPRRGDYPGQRRRAGGPNP